VDGERIDIGRLDDHAAAVLGSIAVGPAETSGEQTTR
jgi:hypothetical protein